MSLSYEDGSQGERVSAADENVVQVFHLAEKAFLILYSLREFFPNGHREVVERFEEVSEMPFMEVFRRSFQELPAGLKRQLFAKLPPELFFLTRSIASPREDLFDPEILDHRIRDCRIRIGRELVGIRPLTTCGPYQTVSEGLDRPWYMAKVDALMFGYMHLAHDRAQHIRESIRKIELQLDQDDPLRFLMWTFLDPQLQFDRSRYNFAQRKYIIHPDKRSHVLALYALHDMLSLFYLLLEIYKAEGFDGFSAHCEAAVRSNPLFAAFVEEMQHFQEGKTFEFFDQFSRVFLSELEPGRYEVCQGALLDCNAVLVGGDGDDRAEEGGNPYTPDGSALH